MVLAGIVEGQEPFALIEERHCYLLTALKTLKSFSGLGRGLDKPYVR